MASSSSEPGAKPEAAPLAVAGGGISKKGKKERGCTAKERISKMPPCTAGKRSSIYRGVTRHRWTGRYEAHLWDKSTWNQNQNKKGKQVYLGAYDDEEAAARAYDLAALKYWGPGTLINFPEVSLDDVLGKVFKFWDSDSCKQVTDYKRDLDEMQNVSREEYLASLRRKSSGFSRGISKYRGLSSRWDSPLGRLAGSDYFNPMTYGDDPAAETELLGSFPIDRKIDLTGYIKWWGSPHKSRQTESASKSSDQVKHGCIDDISGELRTSEVMLQHTEPYQMPRLGVPLDGKRQKSSALSALSILSQSAAYKSLQEKASQKPDNKDNDNDENENKNVVNKMDHGKAVQKSTSYDVASDKLGAAIGMGGGLSLQKNWYPLTPFLTAPLITSYSATDHLVDPLGWTSLVPVPPTGLARNSDVTKTETSSSYAFFEQEE